MNREPLEPELLELLSKESAGYGEDRPMRARVLAKVQMAIGLGGGLGAAGAGHASAGGASAGSAGAGAGGGAAAGVGTATGVAIAKAGSVGVAGLQAMSLVKVVAVTVVFAAGGVAGGALVRQFSMHRESVSVLETSRVSTATGARSREHAAAPSPGQEPTTAGAATLESIPVTSLPIAPPGAGETRVGSPTAATASPATAPTPTGASGAGDLARESDLLDLAAAALAQGRADDAIVAARQHERVWPNGRLAEEREVIIVQALAASGRRDEATQRARRFHAAFPASMMGETVDRAVAGGAVDDTR